MKTTIEKFSRELHIERLNEIEKDAYRQLPLLFKELYYCLLCEEMNLDDYKWAFDEIQKKFSAIIRREFARRLDKRTLGEFAVEIFLDSRSALYFVKLWCEKYSEKHYGEVLHPEDNGVEPYGMIIYQSDKGEDAFKQVDYKLLNSNNEFVTLLELKRISLSRPYKATPKKSDMLDYAKQNSAVLMMYYRHDEVKKLMYHLGYILMLPDVVRKIALEIQNSTLKSEFRHEIGWKECVQFYFGISESCRKDMIIKTFRKDNKLCNKLSVYAQPLENYCEFIRLPEEDEPYHYNW